MDSGTLLVPQVSAAMWQYSNYEPILVIDNRHILFGDYKKPVCPFPNQEADGKTLCKIHNVKPLVCKEFPLHNGHVRTDALDLCRSARDYFERCAELAGKSLPEKERATGLIFPELREKEYADRVL